MDTYSKKVRSYTMSMIRSKDSKPELMIRHFLHVNWFRYRLFDTKLPWKPDIVLKRYKTVIFINWCFRHCHSKCKHFIFPKSNLAYRKPKLKKNVENDKKNIKILKKAWRNIIIIRECQLKNKKKTRTLKSLLNKIQKF